MSCLVWPCELSLLDRQTGAFCVLSASECVRLRSATAGRTLTQNALVRRTIHTATPDKTGLPRLPVDRRRRERAGQVRPLTRSSVVRHESVNKLWIAACLNFFADNTVSSCQAGDVNLALVVLVCCFISQCSTATLFTTSSPGERNIAMVVCFSIRSHISETQRENFIKCLVPLRVAGAQSSCGSVGIYYLQCESKKFKPLRISDNNFPTTENVCITFYTFTVCSYLRKITQFYSIIFNFDKLWPY